jgi:hypothetical protein
MRLLGARRLLSIDTIRTLLDDGRAAERYVDLLKLQDARADSDMRLSMLQSIINEWCRLHPNELRDIDGLTKMIMTLLKIEQTRIGLNGWAAPSRVAHSLDEPDDAALPPADMVRAIAAARAADEERRMRVIEGGYPGPDIVPPRRSSRQPTTKRQPDDDRRTGA